MRICIEGNEKNRRLYEDRVKVLEAAMLHPGFQFLIMKADVMAERGHWTATVEILDKGYYVRFYGDRALQYVYVNPEYIVTRKPRNLFIREIYKAEGNGRIVKDIIINQSVK
jgi:hypothetical protein